MSRHGPVEARRLGEISTADPTLTLLGAYSRDWVLPLFAEYLEPVEGSVSAEWFHERVAEALQEAREDKEWQGDRSPSSRCAWWVKQRWLDTEMSDSGVRYRLPPYSLRALRFVREIAEGKSTVSGARLGSIAHAVRRLADMTSPDRLAQAQRIDEEIAELQRRKQKVLEGRGGAATVAQLSEPLREVLAMTRSLPADFRQLRSMVEERHKVIARDALAEIPKADMVESYLHENDLLASTSEGVAYRRFARMLSSSEESATIQRDLDQILAAPFARDHMTPAQRQSLEAMFSTLMSAELEVQEAYVRWTASLRRVLTRAADGQHARLLSLSSLALEAAADWVAADPHSRGRELDADVLGVGLFGVEDVSQLQLWRDAGPQNVTVSVTADGGQVPAGERAALNRLRDDLSWEDLDLEPTTRRLAALAGELDRADNPEQRGRRAAYDTAQRGLFKAGRVTEQAQQNVERLSRLWGAVLRAQDAAHDIVDAHELLTADELAAAAALPFKAPTLDKIDLGGRDVDEKTDAAVRASYLDAASLLEDQIRADDLARASHERTLLATIRAYRNINDRAHREIDDAIESLAALEQIHKQLVTDDLPRTRTNWLKKVDADLNQGLRALLQQIDIDRREITRGLGPINAVLAGVPFRHDSHLAIEPVDHPNSNLQEFRKVVLAFTRDNPLGEDLFNDETKIEASFRRLRKSLERLTDPSRAGESWRRSVFDAREHVTFRAIETPSSGKPVVHEGVSGMSGGEGQELIAFILGAALRYRLGEGGQTPPAYGCVVLDEGFVKADSDYTGRALRALQELGFQLIIGAPREKATAFEDFVDLVAYISTDPDNPDGVRIYSMTIQEALQVDQDAA